MTAKRKSACRHLPHALLFLLRRGRIKRELCLFQSSTCPHQHAIHQCAGEQTCQGIDGIMGQNIHRGEAHQDKEGQQNKEKTLVAGVPGEQQNDGADAHMTAGKGGRWAFAGFVSLLHQLVEEAIGIARTDHSLAVRVEIIAQMGENARCYLVESYGRIIVLRTGYGQYHEDNVEDEEGCDDDERCPFELYVTIKEVEQHHNENHGEVRGITQIHQLAEKVAGNGLMEHQ